MSLATARRTVTLSDGVQSAIASSVEVTQLIGALASALAALGGALFAVFSASRKKQKIAPAEAANAPEQLVRLDEVRAALRDQERIASRNRWSNGFFVFSQFVIGAVLATSFAQSQLPQAAVGLLGILVLASSIMQRQFRPDLKARDAKRRSHHLRRLLRDVENELLDIKDGVEGAMSIPDLRREVTHRLSHIEEEELADLSHKTEAIQSR